MGGAGARYGAVRSLVGAAAVVIMTMAAPAAAQTMASGGDGAAGGRRSFAVAVTETAIEVDGVLGEAAWSRAVPIPLPYETLPGDNAPAPVATECRVTYDRESLYFGCRARDPEPSDIRAYITDRDAIDDQDWVAIAIDPFNDSRRAFQFAVSALGVQRDALFDETAGWDTSWDAIWESAGRITEDGYVVEAAVPFKSLRFPDSAGPQTWGFFALRTWPRSDRVETQSMYWDRGRSCRLCQANLLTGIEDVAPGLNVELTPTVTGSRTDRRPDFPAGAVVSGPVEAEAGLDLRWGITTDLTMNATVNPDFSQVEADVAQLDVNNRFALFFPERRPFFLEGADLFSTPMRAVFTRSIADPSLGAKLTGKAGASALGLIVARDEINTLLLPGNDGSSTVTLEEPVTTLVGRYRRDVGAASGVGALITAREGDGYHNRLAGADAFLRPFGGLTARLQYLRSESRYRDGTAPAQPAGDFGGHAVNAVVEYEDRDWYARADLRRVAPGFRADAGFMTQVDTRSANVWGRRSFWGDDAGWFTRLEVGGGLWHDESTDGRLNVQGVWTNLRYEGPLQSNVWLNPNLTREHYDGRTYEQARLWLGGGLRPSGAVGFNLWGSVGDAIDYGNGRAASIVEAGPSLELRLGQHVELRLRQQYQRLDADGREIFTASISELRAIYNFSPRAFVRGIFQLRDTDRDPAMYTAAVDRERRTLFSQLLFSYKLNPQSVLFVGYSDDRSGVTAADLSTVPLTQRGRRLFMKMAYAWRP